jgi:hypothetical protein
VGEKSAVGAHPLRPFAAVLLDQIDHRQQRFIVVGLLRHPLRHNQMILAHRQRSRLAQHKSPTRAQKTAVRIALRKFLQSALVQPF